MQVGLLHSMIGMLASEFTSYFGESEMLVEGMSASKSNGDFQDSLGRQMQGRRNA